MDTFKEFYGQYRLVQVETTPFDTIKSAEKTSTTVLIPESIFKEFIYFKLISRNPKIGMLWEYRKNKTDLCNTLVFGTNWTYSPKNIVICNGHGFAMGLKSNIDLTISSYLDLLEKLAAYKQSFKNVHNLDLNV